MTAFVEIDSVRVDLGTVRVLDGFSLAIHEGETLALIGRSGSGKTTALRLVNALAIPTAGSVRVAGRKTTEWNPIELRRRCGYVIQDVGLFPHRTVAENVATVCELEGWPRERIDRRVDEMLELVGLPMREFGARRPRELSGGQRQRVGVARALAADPPLLLLDEPFAALDAITRRELQREFRSLAGRLHKTVLFVTHDLREAAGVADRVAVVAGGACVANGTISELGRAARSPDVQALLDAGGFGDPTAGVAAR